VTLVKGAAASAEDLVMFTTHKLSPDKGQLQDDKRADNADRPRKLTADFE